MEVLESKFSIVKMQIDAFRRIIELKKHLGFLWIAAQFGKQRSDKSPHNSNTTTFFKIIFLRNLNAPCQHKSHQGVVC